MQLDCENEWFKRAGQLPWRAWEALYASLFPSDIGNVTKPCRMVLGSLISQLRMGFSDRDLVKQIQENQYFIGLETFQHVPPFAPTLLVEWRNRIELFPPLTGFFGRLKNEMFYGRSWRGVTTEEFIRTLN